MGKDNNKPKDKNWAYKDSDSGNFRSDVKPQRYEKPTERPAPSPKPPKK